MEIGSTKYALIEELLEAMNFTETMLNTGKMMFDMQLRESALSGQDLGNAKRVFMEVYEEKFEDLMDLLVPVYVKHFEEETLRAMVDFYKSPAGQASIKVLPVVLQEVLPSVNIWAENTATGAAKRLEALND